MKHTVALLLSLLFTVPGAIAHGQPAAPAPGIQIETQEFDPASGVFRFTVRNPTRLDLVAWVYRVTLRHANGQVSHQDQLNDEVIGRALAKAMPQQPQAQPTRPGFIAAGRTREFSTTIQPPNGFPNPPGPVESVDATFLALVFDDGTGIGEPAQIDRIAALRSQQAKDGLAALGVLKSQATAGAEELSARLRDAGRQLSPAADQLVKHAANTLATYEDPAARADALKTMTQLYELRYLALSQPIIRK